MKVEVTNVSRQGLWLCSQVDCRLEMPRLETMAAGPGMTHNSCMFPETQQQRWMAQWRAAGAALRAQRASELAALSNEQALAAADALLSMELAAALPDARPASSGLVRQQALFHGWVEP